MKPTALGALCAALIATFLFAAERASAKDVLYVGSQRSGEIYVIDADTLEPVSILNIGFEVDDVVGSRDGKMVYGNAAIPNGNPLGRADSGVVYGIKTSTNKIVWWTAIPGVPQHLTVSADGKRLFVPAIDKNYIYVVDTASGRIVESWPSIFGNHGTELSHDGRHLYVGNMFGRMILVYDVATGQVIANYPCREGVRPFKIDDAESRVYYQLSNLHGFEVLNIASGKVERVVDLPKLPSGVGADRNFTMDHGMALTPDGKMFLAAGSVVGYVAIYRLPDLSLVKTIPVGDDPNWIRVRADSKFAYVSNRGSGDLSVIDLEKLVETRRIPIKKGVARFDVAAFE